MVDALGHEDWLNKAACFEFAVFYEGMQAGTASEHKELPETNPEDQPLDLIYKKGKGKGKGKRGPPQGGCKGDQGRYSRDTGAYAGNGRGQKPVCNFCRVKGHTEEDCRKKAAGLIQADARRTGPARSLEHAQAQLNLINGQAPQSHGD